MSAWYVFSAMGFYPVNPASGEYSVGLPLFDECVIHLPSGKDFRIVTDRKTPESVKVKNLYVNGKKTSSLTLRHDDIVSGGELRFEMLGMKQ